MKSAILNVMVFAALLVSIRVAAQDQPQEHSTQPYYAGQHFGSPFSVGLNNAVPKAPSAKNLPSGASEAIPQSCEPLGTACTSSTQCCNHWCGGLHRCCLPLHNMACKESADCCSNTCLNGRCT
jgi:hypothetical protein